MQKRVITDQKKIKFENKSWSCSGSCSSNCALSSCCWKQLHCLTYCGNPAWPTVAADVGSIEGWSKTNAPPAFF